MIDLKNTTCFITDFEEKENEVLKLLSVLQKNINFFEIVYLKQSNTFFEDYNIDNINIKYHKKINIVQYNNFCVDELKNYIDSDYCMLIQLDGHPVNYNLWQSSFLEYDYIGAPWLKSHPWVIQTGNNVGNGGFCIRSKKFMQEASSIGYRFENCGINEDVFLCCYAANHLRQKGIKFAPEELAWQFSVESTDEDHPDIFNSFGYHGKKYTNNIKETFYL